MTDTLPALGGSRPPLLLGRLAHRRLVALADAAADRQPEFAQSLLVELARASLADDDLLPDDVVAVGRRIEYFDHHAGRSRCIDLVWPSEADIDLGRISVLTPIGAALIGLRVGQSIQWQVTDGSVRRLDVRKVTATGVPPVTASQASTGSP
ncbi:MAG: nucleoside diphosphate kinase regulator [Xanthomonadales bacterium]|nr:nucleoside diphosphate kinase regulator [Xanthomonadales bacterium]